MRLGREGYVTKKNGTKGSTLGCSPPKEDALCREIARWLVGSSVLRRSLRERRVTREGQTDDREDERGSGE